MTIKISQPFLMKTFYSLKLEIFLESDWRHKRETTSRSSIILIWGRFSYYYKKKIMWKYWKLKVNIILLNRLYGCGLRKVQKFSQSIIVFREMAINLSLYVHMNVKFYHIFTYNDSQEHWGLYHSWYWTQWKVYMH